MKLIVGLGNPEEKYLKTRHNAGFMALDHFANQSEFPQFKPSQKFKAEISEQVINNDRVILIKPQIFMNNSGEAVQLAANFYKIPAEDILVVYDELALLFGTIRAREGGSSAGHNGVESIITTVGDGFIRLRIGIANELSDRTDASDFVLSRFSPDEEAKLPTVLEATSQLISEFTHTGTLQPHTQKV